MKSANVRPITELKNHTKDLVRRVAESDETVVITQKGVAKAVLMGARAHDRLRDTLAMLKLIAHSQASLVGGRAFSSAEVRAAAKVAFERAHRK